MKRNKLAILLLFVSVLFVMMGQVVMFMGLIFSLLLLFGNRLKISNPAYSRIKVFLAVYVFAIIFELCAILTGYSENEFGGGTLFHPDPKIDILVSQLYWIPFSLFWTYLFTKYSYSRRTVFLTAGLYGVLTEQFFMVPMLLLTLNPFFIVAAPYVFILYGSAITAPYMIVENILPKNKNVTKLQYILPIFVLFPTLFVVFAIVKTTLSVW